MKGGTVMTVRLFTVFICAPQWTLERIQVFFSVMMGSMALGQAGPQFAVLGTAMGAAGALYQIIDRVSARDSDALFQTLSVFVRSGTRNRLLFDGRGEAEEPEG